MEQILLITTSDFKGYVDISSNTNEERRVKPHIANAQKFDIRPLLGDALFFEFLNNVSSFRKRKESDPEYQGTDLEKLYQDLLYGKVYQVSGVSQTFEGIRPALVYFTHARILANSNFHSTANSISKKMNQYSDIAEEREIMRLKANAESIGVGYLGDVKSFLNASVPSYPLWRRSCHCASETSRTRKSGSRITPIF